MDIVLKNWPIIAVVGLAVANWGWTLPDGAVSRQNYFDLLRQVLLMLGAGTLARQPDAMRNVMNKATGRPEEPVIPEAIKKLAPLANAAVARVGTGSGDDPAKKEQAAAQVQREAASTGLPVPDHAAALAVELAVLKTKNGTGDGK